MIKAIQTRYDNYHFRSRQEARWAVWFNAVGLPYRYELEGFDLGNGVYYLPDFYLPTLVLWVEVKGIFPDHDEFNKAALLADQQDAMVHLTWANFDHDTRNDTLTFWRDKNGVSHSASGYWFGTIEGWEAANRAAREARF